MHRKECSVPTGPVVLLGWLVGMDIRDEGPLSPDPGDHRSLGEDLVQAEML